MIKIYIPLIGNSHPMRYIELYYSDTCPNCHMARKLIVGMLNEKVLFKEINVGTEYGKRKAEELGIWVVPTLVVDGEVVMEGEVDEKVIAKAINVTNENE